MGNAYQQLNPVTLLKACICRWKCFILAFLLVGILLGGWHAYSSQINPVYSTKSVVLLIPEENSSDSEAYLDGKITLQELSNLTAGAGAYVELIKNHLITTEIVKDLGLGDGYEARFYNSISVTNITSSPFMEITVTYGDPNLSYLVNEKIIEYLPGVLDEFLISAEVLVIDAPMRPTSPSLPGQTMLLFLEIGAGLLLGFAIILCREIFYSTFRHTQDTERVLGVSTIGFLPKKGLKVSNQPAYDQGLRHITANLLSYGAKVISFVPDHNVQSTENYSDLAIDMANLGFKVSYFDFFGKTVEISSSVTSYQTELIPDGSAAADSIVRKAENLKAAIQSAMETCDYVLLGPLPYGKESIAMDYYDQCDLIVLLLEHDVTRQQRAKDMMQGINRLCDHNICAVFTEVPWRRLLFPPYQALMKESR